MGQSSSMMETAETPSVKIMTAPPTAAGCQPRMPQGQPLDLQGNAIVPGLRVPSESMKAEGIIDNIFSRPV
jgi:hypothetical protein